MSFKITSRVPQGALGKMVPRDFRHYCPGISLPEPITLVVFDDRTVNSGAARKAMKRLKGKGGAATLFVATGFTQEARQEIQSYGGEILARSSLTWTDAEFERFRVYESARVKKPDWR